MYTPSAADGMALYAWELMHALAAHPSSGYRFELVTGEDLHAPFRSSAYAINAVLPPIRHRSEFPHRAAWVADRLTHYARRDWQFLRWLKGRPDVVAVHLQEWTPWLAAPMIRRIRRMGKRVFYTVHNVVPHRYPALLPRAVMDGWVRRASRACDGLFAHTRQLAGQLSDVLGGAHPPIFVSPHGVWTRGGADDANVTTPSLDERLAWRRLLFFGMIRRNKGLDLLLHALRELPGYSVTIAGESHEADYFRNEVRPLIESLRAGGARIDLIDRFVPDDQLAELFATHSAVVLPYRRSFVAQSGVIFLSLAHGLPVVASDAGGLKDLFAEFRVGRSFSGESPAALAEAVRSLFADESRTALAEEIVRARDHYSWRRAAEETIAAYDTVLGRATSAGRLESEVVEDDRALVTTSAD